MSDSTQAVLWHNPACSKSRQALALLRERGVEPTLRHYLEAPPTRQELTDLLRALGMTPRELARSGEAVFAELGLAEADDEALLDAMVAHPILIQRPILLKGERAAVGRPPERLLALI